MPQFLHLLFLVLLGSVIALIGGVFFLFNKKASQLLERYSIPFAAGVLITTAIVGILPEAIEHIGDKSFIIIVLAFLGAFIFEHLIFEIHHHDDNHRHKKTFTGPSFLVIVGDTIHNFVDGIAIGASFFVNPGLGLITALSTFLHEVPHEIGDFGILLKAGWKKTHILVVNVVSASFAVLGAFFIANFKTNEEIVGIMLSVSAGIFLYLGTIDFLPHVSKVKGNRFVAFLPVIIGAAIMFAIISLVPHTEPTETEENYVEESFED